MLDLITSTERAAAIEALHAATALYTVTPVVEDLLDHLDWPRGDRRLCDPSCGDGAFLERALMRLLAAEPGIGAERLVLLVEGWEVHPFAASQARARVARVLTEHGWAVERAGELAGRIVHNRDFLTDGPAEGAQYHAIVGNPPYLRAANVPPLLRAEYDAVLPGYARADLLHGFLARYTPVLDETGEIGAVTADRWLFNSSSAGLRAALGQRLDLAHLERLDASTAFYRPKNRRVKGAPPRIHPVAVVLRRRSGRGVAPLDGSAIYPDALGLPAEASRTLGDIADVRLAPWLGTPGIFVVDEATARRFAVEDLVPAIDTDDVANGVLRQPRRFAIRTYADIEPPAVVLEHLRAELPRMAARGRRTPEWLPPETWAGKLDLSRPSLLVPRIARTLRPVRVPPGVLAVNHNLSIVSAGSEPLERIEAALSSDKAQEWVRAYAPRLENGYFSITTTLLRQLPIE